MKKLFFMALIAISAICLSSCSSSDEGSNENENESAIIGVWQETFYWDRTDWHTWGLVTPPVWEFKADKTYLYYPSLSAYQSGNPGTSGTWRISDKYLSTDMHSRNYSFSEDKKNLTWEHVAILKKYK